MTSINKVRADMQEMALDTLFCPIKFTKDGKVVREPVGKSGVKGDGTWKLDKDGFCTTWKNSKPNCFIVMATGDNKWSVMKGPAVVGVWSK